MKVMISGEPYNIPFEIFNICSVAKHQNIAEGHSKDIQRFLGKYFAKLKLYGTLPYLFGLFTFRFDCRIIGSRFSPSVSPSVWICMASSSGLVCIGMYLPSRSVVSYVCFPVFPAFFVLDVSMVIFCIGISFFPIWHL